MIFPVFLSVVHVVHNQAADLPQLLADAVAQLRELVSDFELIVVDNASTDDSVAVLKSLTDERGLPNLPISADLCPDAGSRFRHRILGRIGECAW